MITINEKELFYKDANRHSKDTLSYEKRIMNLRRDMDEEDIGINSDGSITVGLCNSYAISINDKFQCPLDERKHIFSSEELNIIHYDDTYYRCEKFCIINEIKKSKTNYISEENIIKITNRLKDHVMKA